MRRYLIALIGLGGVLSGCVGVHGTIQLGRPLDPVKLARIVPGATTFREVLTWFGPPDYIIDGTKSVLDEAKFWAEMPTIGSLPLRSIPTRPLRAPSGSVILIYNSQSREGTSGILAGGVVEVQQDFSSARPGEVFVLISKADRTVVAVADGNASRK